MTNSSQRCEPSLQDTINAVEQLSRRGHETCVSDLLATFGRTSHLSVVLLAAAVASTPLSGIPGLSAICGIVILLITAQAFVGRRSIWLPERVARKGLKNKQLREGLDRLRTAARFLDRYTKERLVFLVKGPARKLVQLLCMVGGFLMPFLEFIPFTGSLIAASIALFTIALLTLDGLWVAFGLAFLTVSGAGVIWLL
ncbi:exopolysaccharide biosynthesis protein [Roseobacter weihaiensis]|uniref:exopolysaccharide biosynthesis protein n=1 Tax=Roseobacter weihaiensis TaxID=2763262 RepID=UPI001D0A7AF8|nr:exopolysaccharide biosynthesis protein [Roseobacter sp. H9]